MERYAGHVAAAFLLLAGLGAAACAGGGDGDDAPGRDTTTEAAGDTTETAAAASGEHDRAAYVALLRDHAGHQLDGVTDDEVECVLGGFVDAVGVDRLEAAGIFESVQANPEGTLAESGLTLDEAQTSTFAATLTGCVDVRAWFTQVLGSGNVSPEAAACVLDHVDDPTLTRLWTLAFTGGQALLVTDPELTSSLEQATRACV
ncbi:MAG TPA: hypothetical protein VH479_18200 [Acidimicrobiales bacterium]